MTLLYVASPHEPGRLPPPRSDRRGALHRRRRLHVTSRAQASNSIFDVFLHGIGVYFIGKGIFIGVSTQAEAQQVRVQNTMLEFVAAAWARWTGEETREKD